MKIELYRRVDGKKPSFKKEQDHAVEATYMLDKGCTYKIHDNGNLLECELKNGSTLSISAENLARQKIKLGEYPRTVGGIRLPMKLVSGGTSFPVRNY